MFSVFLLYLSLRPRKASASSDVHFKELRRYQNGIMKNVKTMMTTPTCSRPPFVQYRTDLRETKTEVCRLARATGGTNARE